MNDKPVSHIKYKTVRPPVLYVGTPVILMTTSNEDGTANISPLSSAWALFDRFVCGMSVASRCHENILREMECVINFPSASLWPSVEKIAHSTGRNPVPSYKVKIGYEYVKDKFEQGGFTPSPRKPLSHPALMSARFRSKGRL